eukprot:586003-Ditylum_brightwellii.AAC.1
MVDNATNYSYSHFITGATDEQTAAAKLAYERVLREYGHTVESYHGDNSRFDSEDSINSCRAAQQSYSYCGIGTCHQNGIAENMNKRLTHSARTILLHPKRKWQVAISTTLWPFAYRAAEERHNLMDLNANGLTPLEQMSGHKEELVASIAPPKWDLKARVGIYVGHSPFHAGNVALVLNLQTCHARPQYHVVFDNEFSTVPYFQSSEQPPNWVELVQNHTELATEESFTIASSWYEGQSAHRTDQADLSEDMMKSPKQEFINLETADLKRSPRLRDLASKSRVGFLVTALGSLSSVPAHILQCFHANKVRYQEFLDTSFDGTYNNLSIIGHILSAEVNNENYTLKEMLQQPDREDFELVMYKEVKHMFDKKVWEKVPRAEMMAYYNTIRRAGINVKKKQLMLIWFFKRECHADESLAKHKARLYCHGGQQQWGVKYYETYMPVVS